MSNIVNLVLVFVIFIMVSNFFYQLFHISTEESMVVSAIFIMISVFFAALIGKAEMIYYVLIFMAVLGCIAFIMDFSFVAHEKVSIGMRIRLFFNPSIICITMLFLYTVVAFKGAIFTYPDEIMQWGPAVRYMVETGNLPYGEGFTGADITLSTATMFQYIWADLVPFIERNCMLGNFILTFVPIFLPLSGIQWKDWRKAFFYTTAVFLSFNILTYVKYYVLLQDLVLPMWAGGIIAWLLWKKEEKINWGLLWGALICIGSMKSMVGPLFAGVIIVVLIIRQAIVCQINIKKIVSLKVILLSSITVLATVSMSVIWSGLIHVNAYNRFDGYDPVNKDSAEIFRNIINRAFIPNTGNTGFPNVSFVTLCMLLVLVVCIASKILRDEKRQRLFNIVFSIYVIGFIVFLGIMYFAYISIFGTADSELVAGLERYLAYYMLMGVVPLFSMFCQSEKNISQKVAVGFNIGLMLLLILSINSTFLNKVSTINLKQDATYKTRMSVKEMCGKLLEMVEEEGEGKIFVYGVLSSEYTKMLSWELGNRYQWNRDCYQYYQRTMSDLVTLCDVEKYPQILAERGYKYLWCYSMAGEGGFNLKYRFTMGNVKQGAVYKIICQEDEIYLQYLGNVRA